ncbi:MAG: ABC transporter ATP-binding protein [Bacteroidota bacterium]|nr:ABC transporter ATP-binding protein [Bacteroidota bacterium]
MKKLLELENVNFTYSKRKPQPGVEENFSLKNISFGIDEGDFITIIGKNGSGKSTLVKLISKVLAGYEGNIFYKEKEIHSIERKEFSRDVSYLPQSTSAFNENLIVKEFLLLGRYAHKRFTDFRFSEEDKRIVEESTIETSINALADKHFFELSGGEKQKVLITLSLVQLDITKNLEGKVLIIDEPLTYLDVNYQFEIFNILKRLRGKKLSIIIVIHDLNLALRFSGKTILMDNGLIIKYSKTHDVITEEMLREHFLINSKILNYETNYFINYLPN